MSIRKTNPTDPALCLVKGRPSIRIPGTRIGPGDDPVIRVSHSGGVREMGRMEPGHNPARTLELVGIHILDGFTLSVGGRDVFELFPADMLVFVDGEEVSDAPRRRSTVVRERGSGELPEGTRAVSVRRWGSMEVVDVEPAVREPAPAPEPEPVPEEVPEDVLEEAVDPEPVPEPSGEPGGFRGGEPELALRGDGADRRFVVVLPPYAPAPGCRAEVRLVRDGAELPAGIPDDGAWAIGGAEIDLSACGVPHSEPFDVEVDGRRVFSSPGGNVMFFTASGTPLAVPRGRVVAVHPERIRLGVSGGAKVRILSSDTRDGWVFDTIELGAKGKVYMDIPSYWEQRRQGVLRPS